MSKYKYPVERVAVVAMGCFMPDALNTNKLWENILNKKVSIKEIPDTAYNKSVFYRPDVYGKSNKNDKSYSKVAAIPDEYDFMTLSRKYKIPPAVASYLDNNQKATIYCVDQVMDQLRTSLPKESTAVILCAGAPGHKFENVVRRTFYSNVESHILNHPKVSGGKIPQMEEILKEVSDELLKYTQPITEDTSTGYLQNITAGRIANIFDLWGPSYVVDGACASSLITISDGVAGLLNHEYDAVVTGGSEVTISEVGFAAFCGINALSPDGEYPFDSRANGFVMGLGGGIVVLKRLSDALRDGDHIYSIIAGCGSGSDGKGKFIAAPSEEGQVRVIKGACKTAGYSVDTIEMIEAHGTGTIVGDVVEVSALKKAFAELGAQKENNCGIGSIKSNIGHLRNAAGIAGFIKASLAVYNKVLPATANIKEINPKLGLEGSPFYVLTENKKWDENPLHPRRANSSSYGFGGADCHICIEEFRPEFLQKSYNIDTKKTIKVDDKALEKEEAVFFSGDSEEAVILAYKAFIGANSDASFEKAVYTNNLSVCSDKEWRISICASSMDKLKDKFQLLEQYISEDKIKDAHLLAPKGIYAGKGKKVDASQIAFMFPGQASQYPNMLKELYETYPSVKSFYMKTDAMWKAKYKEALMPLIFGEDEEQLKAILKNTKNTHPALFVSNMAVYKLLSEAGVKADYMIGHSLGEITSIYASEMVDLKSAIDIIGERGFSFDRIDENSRGKMVSVKEKASKVEEIIKANGFKVSVANINSPEQTVVGGESQETAKFVDFLGKNGYKFTELNVSHAFHTEVVAKAANDFYENIKEIKFNSPKAKVMACHLADFYNNIKSKSNKMPEVLKKQILSSVNFTDSVLKLYEEGVRVFIEAGPSNVLTNLAKTILADKDVKIVNINSKSKSSVEGFNQALAALFVYGVEVCPIPSRSVLGFDEVSTIVYQVETKAADNSASVNLTQSADVLRNVQVFKEADIRSSESVRIGNQNTEQVHIGDQNTVQVHIGNQTAETVHRGNQSSAPEYIGNQTKESIVYSGVSIGLPGTFKKAFSDDNFDYISEGKNMIELLTDDEAKSIYDLNVTRLIKTEKETIFKKILSINEVIHFAGKFGKMDMVNDYLVDEKVLNQMTQTVCAGVAAGYEALKDAGIPLVREYKMTASGSMLPGRLVLPKEMQDDTGIIYANGLWPLESVIAEVSKFTAAKFGSSTRVEILNFFEAIISRVTDFETKKMLGDWFALYYSRLSANPFESDVYEFNHNFMALLSSQANNRLAQFIGAAGPNMYINTACASNASSVTVAEDMIRAGHARRMIVIGADISNAKNLMPWFGAGFSSIGAMTESDNLFEAAVPFDNRRSGMILGSGATGIVIEKENDVKDRGMNGICRLLGTHVFNAAGHQSKIDTNKHCIELDRFISKMEKEHNLDRNNITSKLVYCSHETYSHKPGCSYMEKASLESTFGNKFREIKVINTKGMTGHIMGASIEEAVSAKALQYQRIPPVVNYKELDPELEGLNLSKGGAYNFEYVLRAVAAFGGQGNYHLMQRIANGDERIVDKKAYREWIDRISFKDASVAKCGRILAAGENKAHISQLEEGREQIATVAERVLGSVKSKVQSVKSEESDIKREAPSIKREASSIPLKISEPNASVNVPVALNPQAVIDEVLTIYSNVTLYPKEMLDLSMELEADLGVDTVKQATIFSMLAEKFDFNLAEGQALSNYTTIGQMVELVMQNANSPVNSVSQVEEAKAVTSANKVEGTKTGASSNKVEQPVYGNLEAEVLKLISEITLYPVELLEKDMEMEADLGIDTVKQATIFSILSDKYGIDEEKGNISQYRTIGALIDLVSKNSKSVEHVDEVGQIKNINEKPEENTKEKSALGNLEAEVLKLISEITLYPVELLEKDMEMEADLGIDTVKQATIFSILSDRYGIDEEKGNISQHRTIGALIDLVNRVSRNSVQNEVVSHVEIKNDVKQEKNVISGNSSLREQVLRLISEITQYPVEMLEDDMELEADLGVDTIKQATILSEIGLRFGIDHDAKLNPSQLKTIKAIIDILKNDTASAKAVTCEEVRAKAITREEAPTSDNGHDSHNIVGVSKGEIDENWEERELCVQYPIVVEEKIGKKGFKLKNKNILIIGDSSETVKNGAQYLKKISPNINEFVFEVSSNLDELENKISKFTDDIKDVDVILDLGHLGEFVDFNNLSSEKENEMLVLNSLSRFMFYKNISQKIKDPVLRIVCAVSMDGCFGFAESKNSDIDPYYGALSGFYKGLRKEFEKSDVKIVDLGNLEGWTINEEGLSKLKEELEEEFKSYEVGYIDGKRVALKLDNVDRSEMAPIESFDLNHFLITGGGSGITAEIIRGMSKRIKGKFTILGRSPIPADIDKLSELDEGSLEQKKTEIYDQLKKEGKKATPVEVQNEYSKLTKAISVNRLINEVRKNGSDVNYISCDVADFEALEAAINKANSMYGPVNIIIHGAGIEKSRLIGRKTIEEFNEVFTVKANGLCNLYRLVDKNKLKVLIGFSSISGRFGNEAQLDYCCANNFISSFMSMVKAQHKEIKAMSISWSGWKDLGMAWRNKFVKENSEEMGLHLIEPDRGTNEFLNILTGNINFNEVVISKGLSAMTGPEKWHGIKNTVPLIDWISKKDGKFDKVYKVFSVKADPIINHHRLGKTPLVPAVAYMEIGAEIHSLIFGKSEQYCFKNVKVTNPLKLFNENPQEIVIKLGEVSSSDLIETVYYNYFIPKVGKGKLVELNTMKISAKIGDYEYLNENKSIETDDMKEDLLNRSLEEMGKKHNNAIQLGPLFMDEKSAKINNFRYNDKGAILTVALSEEQITNKKYNLTNLLFNPAFADTLMQSCGVHASADSDRIYLPAEIGEFGLVKVPKEPGIFKSYAKLIKSSDEEKVYNVILYNEKGEVNYYAKNVIVKRISQ